MQTVAKVAKVAEAGVWALSVVRAVGVAVALVVAAAVVEGVVAVVAAQCLWGVWKAPVVDSCPLGQQALIPSPSSRSP